MRLKIGVLTLLLAGAAWPSLGQNLPGIPIVSPPGLEVPPATASGSKAPFGDRVPVADGALGESSGRELLMLADSKQTSTVTNNSVNGNSATGAVTIDGAAFQNLSGFAVVNSNTGNNVSFNASLQVNIAINPP